MEDLEYVTMKVKVGEVTRVLSEKGRGGTTVRTTTSGNLTDTGDGPFKKEVYQCNDWGMTKGQRRVCS